MSINHSLTLTMDFEEQLEKAEKLSSPSLVGSSVRSADDSAHNNYIHPEKYKSHELAVDEHKKNQLRNKELSASLDELINEGALIGSEEDFDEILDREGSVKSDARFVPLELEPEAPEAASTPLGETPSAASSSAKVPSKLSKDVTEELANAGAASTGAGTSSSTTGPDSTTTGPDSSTTGTSSSSGGMSLANSSANFLSNSDSFSDSGAGASAGTGAGSSSFYSQQDYSNPNLSEYQLTNQIKSHDDLLSKIKQDDPHRLSRDISKENVSFMKEDSGAKSGGDGAKSGGFNPLPLVESTSQRGPEGFHSPYFRRDDRSESNNRSRSRSRSRSAIRPHLARGDSYTNVHTEDPAKYELPPDFKPVEDEEEPTDRRSRQSKPTMGESIAAIEEEEKINEEKYQSQVMSRDASLLTTGDYTNFNVDNPDPEPTGPYKFNTRSSSSTNYLRSISRSRSRQPAGVGISGSGAVDFTEKNDANPSELYKEGALINEDPYSTIDNLDTMMDRVLHKPGKGQEKGSELEELSEVKESGESEPKEAFESGEIEDEKKKSEAVEPAVDEENLLKSMVQEQAVPEEDDLEEDGKVDKLETREPETKEPETKELETKELEAEPEKTDAEPETEPEAKDPEIKDPESLDPEAKNPEVKDPEETTVGTAVTAAATAAATAVAGATAAVAGSKDSEPETEETGSKDVSEAAAAAAGSKDVSEEALKEGETPKEEGETKDVAEAAATAAVGSKDEDDLSDLDISPEELRKHLESQPVYLLTSLIGGMQIIHKTNRLQTILKANEITFTARDLSTDEEAKKIWRRYSNGKTLPGIVRGDDFIGNWEDFEEANEEYRVRELIYETL